MNCLESHQLVQRFLDGESLGGARGEFDRHLLACPACRKLYSSAERLQMGLGLLSSPVSPASLAERIYGSLLNDYSRRQHRRLVVRYSALAASLLLAAVAGVYLFMPGTKVPEFGTLGKSPPAAVPSLNRSVEEASAAFVSLTRRTADETVENTKLLLPAAPVDRAWGDSTLPKIVIEPPAESLQLVEEGMFAGLEPVTDSAKRAVNLFLREFAAADGRTQ